jgi:hypothetical protein
MEIDDVDSAVALLFHSFTINVNKECEQKYHHSKYRDNSAVALLFHSFTVNVNKECEH